MRGDITPRRRVLSLLTYLLRYFATYLRVHGGVALLPQLDVRQLARVLHLADEVARAQAVAPPLTLIDLLLLPAVYHTVSWRSAGLFQRQIMPQAAPSSGQPRPISRYLT